MRIGLTIISLFISLLTVASISIKGSISNIEKNTNIYIYEYLVGETNVMDSTMVKAGKFIFKYKSLDLGKYKIGFGKKASKDIILGTEDIVINADYTKFNESFNIENSKENEVFNSFLDTEKKFKKGSDKINIKARQIKPNDPDRTNKIATLQAEFDIISKTRINDLTKIASDNSNLYAGISSSYLLSLNTITAEEFYKDASNKSLQKNDVFVKSFNSYLTRFSAGKNQNEIKNDLLSLPTSLPEKSRERETIYLALIAWSKQFDPKFSASIARKYGKEYEKSIFAKRIIATLPKLPPTIGDIAPDFVLKNPEGVEIPLSSTKGKVVLLDFWASWCGPCRRENPNVVKTYNKYKDKGFTVFSVSLDKGAAKWKAAIEKDALVWENHVSDLKGWGSSAGKLYGVGSIPATFLIDENGVVVAKNLRGSQLEQKLKEIFGE